MSDEHFFKLCEVVGCSAEFFKKNLNLGLWILFDENDEMGKGNGNNHKNIVHRSNFEFEVSYILSVIPWTYSPWWRNAN